MSQNRNISAIDLNINNQRSLLARGFILFRTKPHASHMVSASLRTTISNKSTIRHCPSPNLVINYFLADKDCDKELSKYCRDSKKTR